MLPAVADRVAARGKPEASLAVDMDDQIATPIRREALTAAA
jgi:hypothetical protein